MTCEIERRFFKEGVCSISLLMRRYKMTREEALKSIKELWWKSHEEIRNESGEIVSVYYNKEKI